MRRVLPRWPADEVPVGHVTNGVHMPTWDSAAADKLWTEACGKDRWLGTMETVAQNIRRVSDASLWQFRTAASTMLVRVSSRTIVQTARRVRRVTQAVDGAKHLLDPKTLTLGFARRFATYERPDLLLHEKPYQVTHFQPFDPVHKRTEATVKAADGSASR